MEGGWVHAPGGVSLLSQQNEAVRGDPGFPHGIVTGKGQKRKTGPDLGEVTVSPDRSQGMWESGYISIAVIGRTH